ncbi:MAG TPA: hypothetical protein VFS58_13860, partial [Steroidobacteraceae bacterium]|nr:hypothetical protein [Steroidobacteraceae bacterium]
MTILDTIRTNLETVPPPVPTLMPHCADMLLSLVGLNVPANSSTDAKPDSLKMFEGYFRFQHAPVFPQPPFDFKVPPNQLHPD